MKIRLFIAAIALAALPVTAQTKGTVATHASDFDYLLGDWQFTGTNVQYGSIHGFWSAVKLDDGSVLDEYRVTGAPGETYYVTRTLRAWNERTAEWELVSTEAKGGLQNRGTGHRDGGEVHIEQKFGAGTATEALLRITYSNIGADHFSWKADRSTDGGKTWKENVQQLEARRIGPPRTFALTTAK